MKFAPRMDGIEISMIVDFVPTASGDIDGDEVGDVSLGDAFL